MTNIVLVFVRRVFFTMSCLTSLLLSHVMRLVVQNGDGLYFYSSYDLNFDNRVSTFCIFIAQYCFFVVCLFFKKLICSSTTAYLLPPENGFAILKTTAVGSMPAKLLLRSFSTAQSVMCEICRSNRREDK